MAATKQIERRPAGRPPLSSAQLAQTRALIAETARRLFREEGYHAVSMRRLASEIGCTPMSLYTYYDSKIDVLRTLWADVFLDVFAQVARAKPTRRGANAMLAAKCHAYVQYWLDHPDLYRLVFMSSGVSQDEVSVFVDDPKAVANFAVFVSELAAAANRSEAQVVEYAQGLICGLNGIAHSLITISGFAWAPAKTLVSALVDGVVMKAKAG